MKLQGKVAIITGAGRGLGRASAIEMAKEGASVGILSRSLSELEETAKLIKSLGGEVFFYEADVSKAGDVKKVVNHMLSVFGKIDILMNNAAIIGPVKKISEIEETEWETTFAITLKGVFLFSKAVIPHMTAQGGGKIINVTSGLGTMAMPLFGTYSITKAGVIHFTRILAEELKEYNIQVNGLDPGVINTKMQEEIRKKGPDVLGNEMFEEFMALKKRGFLKAPEKVAKLAVFLSSEESDAINGENGTESYYMKFGYKGT